LCRRQPEKANAGTRPQAQNLKPQARRVIELRLDTAHAAADKPVALQAWRNADGRVRGCLQYDGARTGRWAGRGPQPQNFRRESKATDAKIAAILSGEADQVRAFGPAAEVVGDAARGMICAAPGHRLLIGDFSGVESRVLAWVAGERRKLEQWEKSDRTQDKNDHPYTIGGRSIGHTEGDAYDSGKRYDLSFGYQGGIPAYRSFAPEGDNSTDAEIKAKQKAWRDQHPRTVGFWKSANRAAVAAVERPGVVTRAGQIRFRANEQSLRIKLPSGRYLSYPFPRLTKDGFDCNVVVFKDNAKGKWVDYRGGAGAYGGTRGAARGSSSARGPVWIFDFSDSIGQSETPNHVRGDGSFPRKRSPGAGDGCAANHCQPRLLLVAELAPIADTGAGDTGIGNGS
jgi:DNA polymerase